MQNEPLTVKKISVNLKAALKDLYETREAEQITALLFRHYKGWNRADLKLRENDPADPLLVQKLRSAEIKLLGHWPVQYIIGVTSFCGMELSVTPSVLIPRPETEELAERIFSDDILRQHEHPAILDIGTGSGCLAIALKKRYPAAQVEAVDVSASALVIAAENAAANGAPVTFRQMDILDRDAAASLYRYHLIMSNPPYVTGSEKKQMSPHVWKHEPHSALFVPDADPLLFYRGIGSFAARHLLPEGRLWLEINEMFGKEVRELLQNLGFERVEVIRDLRGKDRFVSAAIPA